MSNTMLSANGAKNEMSLQGATALRDEINLGLKALTKGYMAIMPQFNKLYKCKGFKALGYKNITDCAKYEFGMSHGMEVNLRKVWDMIGTVTVNNEYIVPDKYKDWGFTQLLLIANNKVDFEKANIKPFEIFNADMTVREMTEILKNALEDKAEEQDNNAIDIDSEEPQTEEPQTEELQTEESQSDDMSIFDKLDTIITFATESNKDCELNNWLKPEKRALFDSIISNAKDLKKALKKESQGK